MSLVITGATLADGSALDFAVVDGRIAAASDAPSDAERVDAAFFSCFICLYIIAVYLSL